MNENTSILKVIIAGGGTGGHIYTGIALAEELKKRNSDCRILFVGSRKGLERKLIPEEGYPIKYITVRGLKGKGLIETAKNMIILPIAMVQSFMTILSFKPSLVFGVGGYASGPLCWMASKMKKHVIIIEQNSIPGITNRMLSKNASFAAIAYEKARAYLKCRCEMTGVPLRSRFYDEFIDSRKNPIEKKGFLTVLILGGSQGAHGINQAMIDASGYLKNIKDRIKIIHQTGISDYCAVQNAYVDSNLNAEVFEFIKDVNKYYRISDFVISRSGAITTAEISYIGLPAVFIPLPNSIYDHQMHNAAELVERGAAVLIKEQDLKPEQILKLFREMLSGEILRSIEDGMNKISRVNSSKIVIDKSLELLNLEKQGEKNA
jgi:UDP-N-acetylglucosamine--N-acetylmuramyl-(pentapeptide) pyrophosphoryl-undecaprenol N-acetylglucosamine transferase